MAHRHKKHHAKGGKVFYSGAGSNVAHEAEEKKHGGKVKHHVGHAHGGKAKRRLDRRARGGKLGDMTKAPWSTAGSHHRSGGHGGSGHGGHARHGAHSEGG